MIGPPHWLIYLLGYRTCVAW